MYKILILVALGILTIVFIKERFINWYKVKDLFKHLSITVFGKRGKGKDTLMSAIAYKQPHNCNIELQKNTNIIELDSIQLKGLTRKSLVDNTFIKYDYRQFKQFENITFVSDAGIYFPSYDNDKLNKEYYSLAVSIALWRQLYDAPIHFNTQSCERLWKILREQVEDLIEARGTHWGLFYVRLKVRYYEKITDAIQGLAPLKEPNLFFAKSQEMTKIENSKRGEIKDYSLLIPKYKINHDTYYFKKIIFDQRTFENEKHKKNRKKDKKTREKDRKK